MTIRYVWNLVLINTNEKGSTAYAIEPYFLYKKDHRARGGTQRWSAAGYYRNQRGGCHAVWGTA